MVRVLRRDCIRVHQARGILEILPARLTVALMIAERNIPIERIWKQEQVPLPSLSKFIFLVRDSARRSAPYYANTYSRHYRYLIIGEKH